MKQNILILFLSSLLVVSCASIPSSTVTLTKEVIKEADDMHQLNIILVKKLFHERTERLNQFITSIYTPAIIAKYEALLPASLDYKKELPNIIKSIIPVINRKKDSLQNVLYKQQYKIISDLNANYRTYKRATFSLQTIINSVTKLKVAEDEAMSSVQNLIGNSLDIKKIETKIDGLLQTTATAMGKVIGIENIIKK